MKKFLIPLVIILSFPVEVKANAYQIGMQWCQMVRSGMDAGESWRMITEAYAAGKPLNFKSQRSDPFAPWYDNSVSGRMGDAIGAGITSGLMAVWEIKRMAPDINRTTSANCPEYGLILNTR